MRTLTVAILFFVVGCGIRSANKVKVNGTVAYGGKPVDAGEIRFVPIDALIGPASFGTIAEGRFEIVARGGVPITDYRVEIDAFRRTGRKVPGQAPARDTMVDELAPVGPPEYRDERSPLKVDASTLHNGDFEFVIPSK